MKKEGYKHCSFCAKRIFLKKDHFVLVGTYNRTQKPDDDQYFHFICWVDYFNDCVTRKAKQNVARMQEQALKLMHHPAIAGVLSQIQGSDQILSMLQTPLNVENIDLVSKVSDKIQNGRKKRAKSKKN
jgi:hypothetical protein